MNRRSGPPLSKPSVFGDAGVFALAIALLATACSSSRPEGEIAIDTFPATRELEDAEKPTDEECNLDEITCSKDEQAKEDFVCATRGYGAFIFVRPYEPKGWGPSACEARRNLIRSLCERKISPAGVDPIQCTPDPSSGHCPAKPETCPDTEKPVVCTASTYMDQKLDRIKAVRGWGTNRCAAMNSLRSNACGLGFDPQLFSQVNCRALKEANEECPPQVQVCEKDFAPATCRVKRYNAEDVPPIVANGKNSCEAQAQIYQITCQKDMLPSKLGPVECNKTARKKTTGEVSNGRSQE